MTEFGPKIADLMDKAGIHGDELQLDYLMDRVNPELRKALIISRPKDLREAISIATEIEYGSGPTSSTMTSIPYTETSGNNAVIPMEGIQQTNAQHGKYQSKGQESPKQEKRTCFFCKKAGNLRKDCRKLKGTQKRKEAHQNTAMAKPLEEEDGILYLDISGRTNNKQ